MFEKLFNRQYEMDEFPYFVPKEEMPYNFDFARNKYFKILNWSVLYGKRVV